MEAIVGVWWAWLLGALPLLEWLLWWWNELWYAAPLRLRYSGTGTKLPPGHMGLPFFREMFKFLYFKVLRRPDEFINSKRRRYGDGAGAYRTHLFGSPSIITFFFVLKWPNVDLVGRTFLVAVDGTAHGRIRSYISNAINKPDALRRIATAVQPRMVASLRSGAQMGRIKTFDQVKKLTFENIGKLFASLEPGPALDDMDRFFGGVVKGIRAQPLNFPGTAYHHALKCRKKLEAIFRVELEKKKNHNGVQKTNDPMDGLTQMKDDEGNALSDQGVLDNIVSLVVAGYESTSLATMWAVYFLAKSPNVLQNLRDEKMAMRKDKQDFFITSEDVSKLKYTNQVVEETIRMANIAAFGFRLTTQEVEYKGYVIPKNWTVVLWFRYFQTNPRNFDNPMCFNPDRWNEPARPGTYQVFGGGRIICAGNMLARIQLALFLHHLSIGYRWELLNPDAGMIYLSHPKPVDGVEVKFSALWHVGSSCTVKNAVDCN